MTRVAERQASFAQIIRQYRRDSGAAIAVEQIWFGDATLTLDEAVRRAALSRGPFGRDGRVVMHAHQRRIGEVPLRDAAARLAADIDRLAVAADFAGLHAVVESMIGPIPGIGDLAIYDIAHRIGMRLGHAPEVVYLHAGTRDGAFALGFPAHARKLSIAEFPAPLSALTAVELEDLLCIYKHELRAIMRGQHTATGAARR